LSTPYHSKYWAAALTLRGANDSIERLSGSIASARVDLNPHQVDAALFALRSPLSRGVILADEVGLGKTIEAGIVISQRWAERRRKILLILPATLRKQWQQELIEKFGIDSLILESATYNQIRKASRQNPFLPQDRVVICSYHFAAARADELRQISWDQVVIDEAHRLRNVYKPSNKMANAIARAVENAPKLLLTATPLQNSLAELYGLVSVIDPHVFGDMASFRDQFLRGNDEASRNQRLKQRLQPVCQRTLRKQVLEYIRFTRRIPLTEDFYPTDEEQRLYDQVSLYLQRESLLALPNAQRTLMTLVLRKLLASSTFAIAGTLRSLVKRLKGLEQRQALFDEMDLDDIDELADELEEEDSFVPAAAFSCDANLLRGELAELESYAQLAEGIQHNAKGQALVRVLQTALEQAQSLGAARKAVVFTESRRTQAYLFELLRQNGYEGQIVLISGSNADPLSTRIYQDWLARHRGSPYVSGSRTADTKAALIEEFRDRATLLIATESAAEGVNLQFASLVVNYDLPWNPQRVEQRIGRCHRYGQQHDVVVVNFLNRRNAADQRVFQLLAEKFRLFDGVFGASDEVLGALESGVDIEKRIAQVYQECRTAEEIQTAFDALQAELDDKISQAMMETRRSLLENFDEEVHARLRLYRDDAQSALTLSALSRRSQWLLALTRFELDGQATFEAQHPRFQVRSGGLGDNDYPGSYNLDWKEAEARDEAFYSPEHPLAQRLLQTAFSRQLPLAEVAFDYHHHGANVAALLDFVGKRGWLEVSRLAVESLNTEEFMVFAGQTDDGIPLDDDQCQKLLGIAGKVLTELDELDEKSGDPPPALDMHRQAQISRRLQEVDTRNGQYFDEEVNKLDRWADDLKFGLEREIRELDKDLREARSDTSQAVTLTDKLAAQKALKNLEAKRNKMRRDLYDQQDAIDAQRNDLIAEIEKQLKQRHSLLPLFRLRWRII